MRDQERTRPRRGRKRLSLAPLKRRFLRSRLKATLNAATATWVGVLGIALGFTALFYTWGRVAGLLNVAEQMPYLVIGGAGGLALIIGALAVTDIAVQRQERGEQHYQLGQLERAVAELRETVNADERRSPRAPRR